MSLLVEVARIRDRRRLAGGSSSPSRRPLPASRHGVAVDTPSHPPPTSSPPPALPPSEAISPPAGLDEEGLYVFHERVGIGLELGMTEGDAARIAGVEAWLATSGAKAARLREVTAKAIETFGGAWAVEVRPGRKETP